MNATNTIIIGAGQAGLSTARYLKERNIPFIIFDENEEVGTVWKERYDSLELDSFAKYSHLEGFLFSGNQKVRPKKDEVASYLKSFSDFHSLDVKLSTKVLRITKSKNFIVETNKGNFESENVVLATGPFHTPFIPSIADQLPQTLLQIHSKEYKNPEMFPPGPILVVGSGNSGTEIAEELAHAGRKVFFSFRGKLKSVSSTELNQWLAYRFGLAHLPRNSLLGCFVIWYTKGKSVGTDVKALARNPLISFVGRISRIEEEVIKCEKKDLEIKDLSAVIWATGHKDDFSLISISSFDARKIKRGVSNIPGLYLLNIRWHHSKSSSHLAGVSRDAKYIASKIAKRS